MHKLHCPFTFRFTLDSYAEALCLESNTASSPSFCLMELNWCVVSFTTNFRSMFARDNEKVFEYLIESNCVR